MIAAKNTGVAALVAVMMTAMPATAKTMVYVSNADSREISVLELDAQLGELKPVETVPVTGTAMPMAVSPDKRHLYVSLRSQPFSVSTFAIDRQSGKLGLLSTVPLPDNMAYVATDRTGRFLLSASYTGDKIAINPIDAQGAVGAEPVQVVPTRKHAHAILADRANKHVFASNLGGDILLQYKFDAMTGRVTPNEPPFVETKKGAGPRHFVFSPDDRFAYLVNELDGTLNAYRFDAARGTLAETGSVSIVPRGFQGGAPASAELRIMPNGRFIYASERTSNTIAAFRVDGATGALTPAGNFATETQPRGFNIDQSGRFLIAAGQKSDSATLYAIDAESGALKELKRYPLGKNPNWVEIIDLP
ncbi:6-phosphogluconolactonase [Bosea sp. Root483D1]|uniref:lactonase family protein n=1 Tax=Bosea sp. Root483D1 TaxID=1736544 RepID=UPI00070E6471|nr:beta-propeller fold lactonase family protein [Bosea sp. Root483D1]KRE16699.1 6-phosphogluconolactonase [Bosea sp. Root483D1]